MLRRFPFTEYLPDQPLSLVDGSNVVALPNGYRPAKAFASITVALAGWKGGAAFIGSDGTSSLLSGTATNLYKYSGAAWTSVLGSLSATVWRFDQFGDNVICANGGTPVRYGLVTGTAALLGGSPPNADMVATVRQQVFLAGNSTARNTLYISGYNNSEQWTAGTNQGLNVPFPSGGDIMGLAGGETGIILQQRSVKRATYTGDVTIWQFDEISKDIGCMAKGSVAQAGLLVFFLSEQGFKVCDRNEVRAIGAERVDRTFFARYGRADIQNITAAIDPRTTTVSWAMPGVSGQIWSYNWALDRWSPPTDVSVLGIFSGFSSNTSMDALDATYPGGLDTVPYSPDASIFQGGNPLFLLADQTGVVGSLSGANLAASLSIAPVEVADGFRVRVRGCRVVGDPVAGTVNLDVRARAGDAQKLKVSGAIRNNGRVPIRANGRHVGMTVNVPASSSWTYLTGVDLDFETEGLR